MAAANKPSRINEIQARILTRLEAGEELHRTARWIFPGDRRQTSWSSTRQLERLGLIAARDPKAEVRIYVLTEFGRQALAAHRGVNGTETHSAESPAMAPAPHDRPILVLTREEGLWLTVRWDGERFTVINGDGSWVEEAEVETWKEAPHASIGIGTPRGD